MRILFDNGVPRGLAAFLSPHSVEEARDRGWTELVNGKLIAAAEQAGFDALLTTDKRIRYQQNLRGRRISLLVLQNAQWPQLKLVTESVLSAVQAAKPGSYAEIPVPSVRRRRV